MTDRRAARLLFAWVIGAALPHAADALWQFLSADSALSTGWTQLWAWMLVGLPAAWAVARVSGHATWPSALAAAAGGLMALAAPFVAYGLPVDGDTLRVVAVPVVLLGTVWPVSIALLARRRSRR